MDANMPRKIISNYGLIHNYQVGSHGSKHNWLVLEHRYFNDKYRSF